MTPQEPPLAREALELAIESARLIVALGRNPFAAAVEVNSVAQALLTEHAELTALRARLAQAEGKSDAEMERVKACEHIALGDDGWEVLRNLCPSTAAVAWLRDQLVAAESRAAQAEAREVSLFDAIAHGDEQHKTWLKEAIRAHFAGETPPAPYGKGITETLKQQLAQAEAAQAVLVGALEFYADPESYFGVSVFADPPCGGFADDYSETETELGVRHGKLARETLANTSEAAKAMGADAKRYRFVRDNGHLDEIATNHCGDVDLEIATDEEYGKHVDDAVDALARLHAGRGA